MPSRDTRRIASVIAHNITLARRFVEGMSFEAFSADERTLYAVTRCLEIISEASRRLPIPAQHGSRIAHVRVRFGIRLVELERATRE